MKYEFSCPEQKRRRVIINTDAKNEADDQFAIAHALLTEQFDVEGIIAAHFEARPDVTGTETSAKQSYDEVMHVLDLMNLDKEYPVVLGATRPLSDEKTPVVSEGAQMIIDAAMNDDERPLYVMFMGAITDLATAYLMEPRIAKKVTAIWIGGGEYPSGGFEFNLMNDINAANVVFSSPIQLWQVPKNVYKMIKTSLAELQLKVRPHGRIGRYLFDQMVEFNMSRGDQAHWPDGEAWVLGDNPTVSVLLESHEHAYQWVPAPRVAENMYYIHGQNNRPIRVYQYVDSRFTLEDMFAKIAINYPKEND